MPFGLEALGRGLLGVGRGLASGGKALGRAAINPGVARNVYAPAAGGLAGYGAGMGLENMTGATSGSVAPWTAGLGAVAALGRASPGFRNQLRYAARVEPGEVYKPIKSTLNMLLRPKYPIIEPALSSVAPRFSAGLFGTARKLPLAVGLGGAGFAGYEGARYLPNQMTATARDELGVRDPAVQDRIWWDTFKRQPEILGHMYGFNPAAIAQKSVQGVNNVMFGRSLDAGMQNLPDIFPERDTTALGDMHRATVPDVVVPDVMYGLTRARKRFPGVMSWADSLRSVTPGGYAATRALNKFAPKQEPDLPGAMSNILRQHQENFATDPNLIKSPLGRIYADILARPDVVSNPWAQKQMSQHLPTDFDKRVNEFVQPHLAQLDKTLNRPEHSAFRDLLRGPLMRPDPENTDEQNTQILRDPTAPVRHQMFPTRYEGDVGFTPFPGKWPQKPVETQAKSQFVAPDLARYGLGRLALPAATEIARQSIGPNAGLFGSAARELSNRPESQKARRNFIGNLATSLEKPDAGD